ncbi:MAG: hypothetical protein GXO19_06250 [Epsilonproteobacteria bacterium]|nr:hypothetical protein [Campylobacterota bacterium]NPA57317.1 hypothetical protein [Campylobacterota bacterium]
MRWFQLLLALGAALHLPAFQVDSSYLEALKSYLKGREFPINGRYYSYDFDRDGVLDPSDWIYFSSDGQLFQLMGREPSPEDPFGWKLLSAPPEGLNLQEPTGYFVFINMPLDRQRFGTDAFSWIYLPAGSGDGYKLMGAQRDHTFDYLDIDGDGIGDPIPGIRFSIEGEKVIGEGIESGGALLFYGETDHKSLGGWKNVRVFDPTNPSSILYRNDDTTDCRRPAVTTSFTSFDPERMEYRGLHMERLHFVSHSIPYSLSLQKRGEGVEVKRVGDVDLKVTRALRYTKMDYMGSRQYLTADGVDGKRYLLTPEGAFLPFHGRTLLELSYPSFGAPIDGYIVDNREKRSIEYCSIDMGSCQEILSYSDKVSCLGSVGGSTESIYIVDGESYIYDKTTRKMENLHLKLPPKVGHTTPYALNGRAIYYVEGESLYRYDLDRRVSSKLADGLKTARIRAFTRKMVIVADDDYIYGVAKDGSTPQALLLSQTTETRGHKYSTSMGTGRYYLFNRYRVTPDDGTMHFFACLMEDQEKIECKKDSFWASTIVAAPNGVLDFEASYIYTPAYFIRIDETDNYGGGVVKAVDGSNPLGEGVVLGKVEHYNFQTFINSGYRDEMVGSGGYIILNGKNDLTYRSDTFLAKVDRANSLQNISHEPSPPDSEINGGRSHCHGRYCVICHSFAGGKIYASWDPEKKKYEDLTEEMAGRYTIQFLFNTGETLRAQIKKGMGENFNTPLQNLAGKRFTAQVIERESGKVVNSSDQFSHNGAEYFNCNYCHYRYGPRNGAPGVITVNPIP